MAAASNPELAPLAPLVTILSKEQAIYQGLLDVAQEERAAIVARKLPDLRQALQRKQEILAKLADLEDRRVAWLRRYARRRGLDLSTLTLATIIDHAEASERRALARLHTSLKRHIEAVVELNHFTGELLQAILKSIDVSLRFLMADDGAGQTYGSQGRLHESAVASRQLLECRA